MESFYGASQGTKAEALILVRTIVAHLFKERGWDAPHFVAHLWFGLATQQAAQTRLGTHPNCHTCKHASKVDF